MKQKGSLFASEGKTIQTINNVPMNVTQTEFCRACVISLILYQRANVNRHF